MALLELMTLLDLRGSVAQVDGGIIDVAEMLVQENEALTDVPWAHGNLLTGDIHYKRTAMPMAHKVSINQGIKSSVSKKEPQIDTCIQIASRSAVDMRELQLAPEPARFLALEAKPHIAIMGEDVVHEIFYGNDPDGVMGIAPRYNKLGDREKGRQIIDFGGTGSNLTSVFFVKWDGQEVTGICPKNAPAGLAIKTMTDQLIPDVNGDYFYAHVTDYSQYFGLKIRDHRFISRLCNIDMDAIATDATARQKLFRDLITTKNRIFHVSQGRVVMYMSPDLANIMEIAAFDKENAVVSYKEGITSDTRIVTFSGVPIRKNDFMLNPEKRVA
ncbi:MAG: hypothetical protein LBJ36_01745 [Synergistaceae bacterium]|jgi:hypothetical protein|nr:hypothetical protein [Synergistaceae bacterium]